MVTIPPRHIESRPAFIAAVERALHESGWSGTRDAAHACAVDVVERLEHPEHGLAVLVRFATESLYAAAGALATPALPDNVTPIHRRTS